MNKLAISLLLVLPILAGCSDDPKIVYLDSNGQTTNPPPPEAPKVQVLWHKNYISYVVIEGHHYIRGHQDGYVCGIGAITHAESCPCKKPQTVNP